MERIIKATEEQALIWAWFACTYMATIKHLVINALPGTGKTFTTLNGIAKHAKEAKILYLVFMSKNAVEARAKVQDPRIRVETCNAYGNQILNRCIGYARPTDWAEWNRIRKVEPALKDKNVLIATIAKLVSAAKNKFIGVPSIADLIALANERMIFPNDAQERAGWNVERFAKITSQVMELSLVKSWERSWDDQIWLPITLNLIKAEYDLVVADEAQDLNALNYEMMIRATKPGGRTGICGDVNQGMYGFRGAMQDGMAIYQQRMNAAELKLTWTFRVPKTGVAAVNHLLPEYKAHADNAEGEVLHVTEDDMTKEAAPGDAILSRTNAPLVPKAFGFIRAGKPVRIEGKDIGRGLLDIIRTLETTTEDFTDKLGLWEQARISKVGTGYNSTKKIELITDQAETLRVLWENCDTIPALEQRIKDLFQDSVNPDGTLAKPAIVLSTVHKAKGLEWPRVYVLTDSFGSSRKPETPQQVEEEKHIVIVAHTRHLKTIAHVSSNGKARAAKATAKP